MTSAPNIRPSLLQEASLDAVTSPKRRGDCILGAVYRIVEAAPLLCTRVEGRPRLVQSAPVALIGRLTRWITLWRFTGTTQRAGKWPRAPTAVELGLWSLLEQQMA
mmetsp:Transcript_13956/g.32770  ORF Transcript_13956/g.32770 Transcript_13956/m.32770 type:complete len:106 (-) Transcript_13956:19-336(-)